MISKRGAVSIACGAIAFGNWCLCCAGEAGQGFRELQAEVNKDAESVVSTWDAEDDSSSTAGRRMSNWALMQDKWVYRLLAEALPVDWYVHREIVLPLLDSNLLPAFVPDMTVLDIENGTIFVIVTYGRRHEMGQKSVLGPKSSSVVDRLRCTGPFFRRRGIMLARSSQERVSRIVYVRQSDMNCELSRVTVAVSCRVRQKGCGAVFDLVASEEFRFRDSDAPGATTRHWTSVNRDYMLLSSSVSQGDLPSKPDAGMSEGRN